MRKVSKIGKKIITMLLVVAMLTATIDTNAFAGSGIAMVDGQYYDTLEEAVSAALQTDNEDEVITLYDSVEIKEPITIQGKNKIVITGSSEYTITTTNVVPVFTIEKNTTLSLTNITIDGQKEIATQKNSTHGMIVNGKLVMNNSVVKNFKGNGAAILLDGATLQMDKNSEISNNVNDVVAAAGGGIYAKNECHISGGNIKNNSASYTGAGIYAKGSTYIEDVNICDNIGSYGVGIYVSTKSYINNCNISKNKGSVGGFGVYVSNRGNVEIYNTVIKDNYKGGIVSSKGGALQLEGNAGFTLAGATITGNTSTNGGGINITSGVGDIKKADTYDTCFGKLTTGENIISNNTAVNDGGAI